MSWGLKNSEGIKIRGRKGKKKYPHTKSKRKGRESETSIKFHSDEERGWREKKNLKPKRFDGKRFASETKPQTLNPKMK